MALEHCDPPCCSTSTHRHIDLRLLQIMPPMASCHWSCKVPFARSYEFYNPRAVAAQLFNLCDASMQGTSRLHSRYGKHVNVQTSILIRHQFLKRICRTSFIMIMELVFQFKTTPYPKIFPEIIWSRIKFSVLLPQLVLLIIYSWLFITFPFTLIVLVFKIASLA